MSSRGSQGRTAGRPAGKARRDGSRPTPAREKPRFFATAAAFRAWLEVHAATASELLVGYHKVGTGRPSITWSESVDEALCFGWIDGIRRRIDNDTYSIRFTPRKPTSTWSSVNIAKVKRLSEEGRMTRAGEKAFAARTAARSGIYSYEQEQHAQLSAAERRTFQRSQRAWTFFEATPPSYRKALLHWVTAAKRPETRAARLAKLIDACAREKRLR